ncbi:TPA: hypothetical protein HA219_01885 [Candidatus Woesearchaeota archaeon]|nr:hypothetical protein [Candidatus Woesearchaeota archaeon]HIH39450.1 hypothetical protein [Candidatus Woesearchaeota archaeon]
MTEVEVITKGWGSSIGVIIPKAIIKKEHIGKNEKIIMSFKKAHTAKEIFGLIPTGWKKTTQELKDEARKGWE